MGKSVAYEFDVEIDNKVLPLKLLEDVNRWEYVDLPIFQMEHLVRPGEENGWLEKGNSMIKCLYWPRFNWLVQWSYGFGMPRI